jgi:hypothetical protein
VKTDSKGSSLPWKARGQRDRAEHALRTAHFPVQTVPAGFSIGTPRCRTRSRSRRSSFTSWPSRHFSTNYEWLERSPMRQQVTTGFEPSTPAVE